MQATRPRPQSHPDKPSIHPGVGIAIGAAGVLAILLALNLFRGSSHEETDTPSAPGVSHPRGGLKLDNTQRARVEGGGWVADETDSGDTEHVAGSVPPRVAGGTGSGTADESNGNGSGSTGGVRQDSHSAAATGPEGVQGGKGALAQSKTGVGATGAANMAAADSTAPLAAGMQGAGPRGGTGSAPAHGGNSAGPAPVAPQQVTAPVNSDQGVTFFNNDQPGCNGPTCQPLPIDSRLNVAEASNVVSGPAGGVSFWLEPQWDANNGNSATLVELGDGSSPNNRFEIYKDGQSLNLTFAGNSGSPIDISSAIDSWQPGQQHLVTTTWSQGPDGQGQVSFYLDGNLAGQQPYSGPLEVAKGTPISIGSQYGDSNATVPGLFNSFTFYKQPLTPEQIAAQVAAGPTAAGGKK